MDLGQFNDAAKYPSYELLEQEFGYFIKQLSDDNELSSSEKTKCLESICVIPKTTKDQYKKECNKTFFYDNKLKGRTCKNPKILNPFVRVNDKDSVVEWISTLTGIKPTSVRNKLSEIIVAGKASKGLLLDSFLNNIVLSVNYQKQDKCYSYFGVNTWISKQPPKLKDAHICFYKSIQWSFPTPKKENIFSDQLSIETIKCRAGITDKNTKLIFQHNLSSDYEVRKPTTFDAGFYSQFLPNGLTKPLTACNKLSGFDEYVHIPNKFGNILDSIYETYKN